MNNIFPIIPLTEVEEDLVREILSKPEIKKYLHYKSQLLAADLLTSSIDSDEPPEEWIRKEIHLKGRLLTLDELLHFTSTPKLQ